MEILVMAYNDNAHFIQRKHGGTVRHAITHNIALNVG